MNDNAHKEKYNLDKLYLIDIIIKIFYHFKQSTHNIEHDVYVFNVS